MKSKKNKQRKTTTRSAHTRVSTNDKGQDPKNQRRLRKNNNKIR